MLQKPEVDALIAAALAHNDVPLPSKGRGVGVRHPPRAAHDEHRYCRDRRMRYAIGILLLGHAVAHLPGSLVNLGLRSFPELPYRTTILSGTLELGESGIKLVGVAWLALALGFIVVAIAALMSASWWQPLAYATIFSSTVLCVLGWPEARIGVLANFVILLLIQFGGRSARL